MQFLDRDIEVCCPNCRQFLQVASLDGFKVTGCSSCHGILLQTVAFGEIVKTRRSEFLGQESIDGPLNQADLAKRRNCPACDSKMDTHPYYGPGNAVIDSCNICNLVWLDQSELYDIIRAPGDRDRVV